MDFLWLIAWIAAVLSALLPLALWRPEHAIWSRVDIWYYSLGLVGVLLFFLADSRDRQIAQTLDARNFHTIRLATLGRFHPAFDWPGSDASVSSSIADFREVEATAAACRDRSDAGPSCAAAHRDAARIGVAFGGLDAIPRTPTPVQAKALADRFCSRVGRLAALTAADSDPAIRASLNDGLARLASGAPRDLPPMRMKIRLAAPERSGLDAQAQSAMMVLNAAAACPPDLPILSPRGAQARSWERSYDLHATGLQKAPRQLGRFKRGEDDSAGGISLNAFARGLWPFFLATALCMKLARAVRDTRPKRI